MHSRRECLRLNNNQTRAEDDYIAHAFKYGRSSSRDPYFAFGCVAHPVHGDIEGRGHVLETPG